MVTDILMISFTGIISIKKYFNIIAVIAGDLEIKSWKSNIK